VTLIQAVELYFADSTSPLINLQRAVKGQTGELAYAARQVTKGGKHRGPCDFQWVAFPGKKTEGDTRCVIHLKTMHERQQRLWNALQAAKGKGIAA
jgi:hypothetical protein